MSENPMMTTREVAEYFEVTIDAVQKWRYRKIGPKFTRVSANCVLYRQKEVLQWGESRVVNRGGRPKRDDEKE